ncbi:ZMYM1 protein, partial [Polyodon spathula]|nr:ZMYM1 protein [Polyodon spathula]
SVLLFRYIVPKTGRVVEHFIGFTELKHGNAEGISTAIRDKYPNAHYVHCYPHQVNLIMCQAASQVSEAQILFQTLSGFSTFFSRSPRKNAVFGRPKYTKDCDTAALKICDIIISHAKEWFAFRKCLVAAKLLQSDHFDEYQVAFPDSVLEETVQAYPKLGKISLCIDLQTVYETKDFKSAENALSMLELMIYNNLDKTFPEITKLLKIVITTPMTIAEAERCFSTLKWIKTFLRNSMKTEQLNILAMLATEKGMMTDILDFNNKVIEKFTMIRHR